MLLPALFTLAASATAAFHGHSRTRPHNHRQYWPDESYEYQCLIHHNIHRQNHSAAALTWSDVLASSARKLAETCNFHHDVEIDGGGYGQNIASGRAADNVSAVITELWYNNEIGEFGDEYGNPDPSGDGKFELWGHFSQVLWKRTRKVGCWTEHCPYGVENAEGTYDYTVCNYGRAGNVAGEYAQNVGEPLGMPVASWRYRD